MGGGTRTLEIPLMAQASLAALGSSCHPPLLTQVALVVFAVHTLVAQENAVDAEKAFVTLTVLSILNKAQAFLPFSIHSVVQVRLGERRPLGGALQGCSRLGPHLHPPTHPQPRGGGWREGVRKSWRCRAGSERSRSGSRRPRSPKHAASPACEGSLHLPLHAGQRDLISPPLTVSAHVLPPWTFA